MSAIREPVRLGLLGAAGITPLAVVEPAHELGVELVAVAARDRARAESFAAAHGVEVVHDSYQDVLDDPRVDVVYNPLAIAQHATWSLRAIAAGKHVLTEKPYASNAADARLVRDASTAAGVHAVEAFHNLYHPISSRFPALVKEGAIGQLQFMEVRMLMPPPPDGDLRWQERLGGGAFMDIGCYAVHAVRDVADVFGGEPLVTAARAGERDGDPGVDAWMSVDLELPNGVPVHVESSMMHHSFESSVRLVGSTGEVFVPNFTKPQQDDSIVVARGRHTQVEHLGSSSTYLAMMQALVDLMRDGVPMRSDAADAVRTMEIIDSAYTAAGMRPRPSDAELAL